jgi:hypothetical protein
LILLMGGKCAKCSATENLEFDCYPVAESSHHNMSWPVRIRFYWKQFGLSNLRLMCKRCHVIATALQASKASGVVNRLGRQASIGEQSVSGRRLALQMRIYAAHVAISESLFCDGDGI